MWCALLGGEVARSAELDPVGVWNCLVYGRPSLVGDERVLVELDSSGAAALARLGETRTGTWLALSDWRKRRGRVEFSDPRNGREFEADLDAASLGGAWHTAALVGGWWCARADAASAVAANAADVSRNRAGSLPELVPVVTATPRYPRQAIREAKEGRAVGCFSVKSNGEIVDPEVVELSDEIFREPTIAALSRSRFRGWDDERIVRPACRSFIFRLDAVY